LTFSACFGGSSGDDEGPSPAVWVLHPEVENDSGEEVLTGEDGKARVTFTFAVGLVACDAELRANSHADWDWEGQFLTHHNCGDFDWRLDPQDVETLTATGTLSISFQHLVQIDVGEVQLETEEQYVTDDVASFPIGPIGFGEWSTLGEITREFEPPDVRLIGIDRAYRVFAQVLNCRLSNGTPCGNNADRSKLDVTDSIDVTATASADTGSQSQGLAPSEDSGFTELVPNENGIIFGGTNDVTIDASGASGSFIVEWWFESTPDVKFSTSGTLTGQRSGDQLSGQFQLDEPSSNALTYFLADETGIGTWSATVQGDAAVGAFGPTFGGGELRFVAELR
jgi:hypothetical protein